MNYKLKHLEAIKELIDFLSKNKMSIYSHDGLTIEQSGHLIICFENGKVLFKTRYLSSYTEKVSVDETIAISSN